MVPKVLDTQLWLALKEGTTGCKETRGRWWDRDAGDRYSGLVLVGKRFSNTAWGALFPGLLWISLLRGW